MFAVAMLAQLAGPVLAANASGLNLLCPSHADAQQVDSSNNPHHEHAHHHDAQASHVADDVPATDHTGGKPRFFDLACCSAHLTGVMPMDGVLSSRMIAPIEAAAPEGGPVLPHAVIDPPPRIFV